MTSPTVQILQGDCLTVLKTLADESVQMVCTSPPYWGLRDYGTAKWESGDAACDHRDDAALAERLRQKKSMIACGERMDGSTRTRVHDEEIGKTVQFRTVCAKCGARRIDQQLGLEATPDCGLHGKVRIRRDLTPSQRERVVRWLLGEAGCGDERGGNAGKV